MKPSENPLGSEPVSSLLRRFAIPSVIAMLVSALYNMVDQLFIGHSIGVLGNAATNVAFPLSMVCTSIGLLCGIGGAANFNLCMGRKDPEHAKSYVGNAISMLAILGVILCVAVQLFLRPMMLLFGATPDVIDYACTYTRITSIGFPFLIITIGGSNLIRADGSPKFSMLCNLIGAIVNTILDPLFIFVFHMGMAGAALATITGQILSFALVVFYLRGFKTLPLSLSDLKPKMALLGTDCCAWCNSGIQSGGNDGCSDRYEQHTDLLRLQFRLWKRHSACMRRYYFKGEYAVLLLCHRHFPGTSADCQLQLRCTEI